MAETARAILAAAQQAGCQVLLPVDVAAATAFAAHAPHRIVPAGAVAAHELILDAGPQTVAALAAVMDQAKTLIWNGPLGAFETPPFDQATVAAAQEAGRRCKAGALTAVAGGGDTVAALNQAGAAADFTYVSTAGGAFLEWMEGKTLPGVAALQRGGEHGS
jgi:phosphoglycerate kinase